MQKPWIPRAMWDHIPHTLTIITTYQCNAACNDCCFGCNPSISLRLRLEDIREFINQAIDSFPGLRLVVFTGGEPFLLGKDLFAAIRHAKDRELLTRCVSNGYWGKKEAFARRTARNLLESGVDEINISTGLDHAKWVDIGAVVSAAIAVADLGIFSLITVEQDSSDSDVLNVLRNDNKLASYLEAGKVHIQSNSWISFNEKSTPRVEAMNRRQLLLRGCEQLFENCTFTPNKEVSGCCGLTFEYIPEMLIAREKHDELTKAYSCQADDFMKIWLKVDGPYRILESAIGSEHPDLLGSISHPCHACAILHQNAEIRERVMKSHPAHLERVLRSFYAKQFLFVQSINKEVHNAT